MTAIAEPHRPGGAAVIGVALVVVLAAVTIGTLLSSLPLTKHAAQGRSGTSLDADTIRRMIDKRECRPIEIHVCPPVQQSKMMCYLKPMENGDELWAGVLVGIYLPHPVITGFVAPYFEYWAGANERDGCYRASRIN